VHLVGFIIRIYHDARSSECHISFDYLLNLTFRIKYLNPSANKTKIIETVKNNCYYLQCTIWKLCRSWRSAPY